jgi:methyl-accepting chemotaxis protein
MFNNMKIGVRFGLGFCVVIGFMIAIIVVSLNQMATSHYDLERIIKVNNVRVQLANNMIDNARGVALSVRGILMLKYAGESGDKIQKMKDEWTELWRLYHQDVADVKKLINNGEDTTGSVLLDKIEVAADSARLLTAKAIDMAVAGKVKDATDFVFGTAYPSVKRWIGHNDDFIAHNEERTALRYEEAHTAQENARKFMFILGAFALALSLTIGIFLTLSITGPLTVCVKAANMIAAKDLTIDLSKYKQRGDEIGIMMQSFSRMVEMLRRQMQEIMDGVNVISSSSSEILAATTQVASGSAENASAISETTTTVEEVRQAAELSSQKAKNMSDSAQRVAQVSQSGKKAVEDTASGMLHIREQMDSIAQTIVRLSEQGQSIGGIIASVTDIADQSNLLAVNAAIEATRAGEQGKAFAVVAQEIKSLAEQSKQATTQVRTILNDVQKATSAAVMATEQGTKAVEAGVKQSAQAGEAIRVLADSSTEAVQTSTQIVASSQQQVVGMNQIGAAMENINQAGAETAASMKQAETAARNLHELGQKLKGLVDKFKA